VGPDRQPVEHLGAGQPWQANYATAKAGIQGFTKTLAIELGKFGVTANAIAPGFIVTDMTKATAERIGQEWEFYVQARAAAIPVARAGQPEDITHTVSFLVSEAAGFVSGQVIYVAVGDQPRAGPLDDAVHPVEPWRPGNASSQATSLPTPVGRDVASEQP
jgi:NAD(P)-dependent dehydrogenase (short-subunit alcohol dehydrogenase family)